MNNLVERRVVGHEWASSTSLTSDKDCSAIPRNQMLVLRELDISFAEVAPESSLPMSQIASFREASQEIFIFVKVSVVR